MRATPVAESRARRGRVAAKAITPPAVEAIEMLSILMRELFHTLAPPLVLYFYAGRKVGPSLRRPSFRIAISFDYLLPPAPGLRGH